MRVTERPITQAAPRLAAKAQAERALRRRRRLRVAGACVLGLVPVLLLGWLLLFSPVLAVHAVAVSGTHRLSDNQVRQAAAVPAGVPLARVDTAGVAWRVRRLRPVASVMVSRGWPNTLQVRVVERTAVAAVVRKGSVTLLDGGGVPFAPAAAVPAGAVRLQVPTPGPSDPTTRAALAVLAELPPSLRAPLRTVRAASPASVTLVLAGGRQVLWGGTGDTALKVPAVVALLRMPGRIFDVSRPGVVTRR